MISAAPVFIAKWYSKYDLQNLIIVFCSNTSPAQYKHSGAEAQTPWHNIFYLKTKAARVAQSTPNIGVASTARNTNPCHEEGVSRLQDCRISESGPSCFLEPATTNQRHREENTVEHFVHCLYLFLLLYLYLVIDMLGLRWHRHPDVRRESSTDQRADKVGAGLWRL